MKTVSRCDSPVMTTPNVSNDLKCGTSAGTEERLSLHRKSKPPPETDVVDDLDVRW